MRSHPLRWFTFVLLAVLPACQSTQTQSASRETGPIEVGGFVQAWQSPLGLSEANPLTRIFLRDDMLYAYAQDNTVYALSASGGQVKWIHNVGNTADELWPPILLDKEVTLVAVGSTIERINAVGVPEKRIEVGHSVRSAMAYFGNYVWCGLDYKGGGRVAQIDLTKPLNNTVWEFMSRAGVSAAPVYFQNTVYAGTEEGRVYAVNTAKVIVWPVANGYFQADGPIVADLKADANGVYVACTDSKFYCLDQATGKIKWIYHSGSALKETPTITADSVYQFVPGQGVAALDKLAGDYFRKPRWINAGASGFLAEDADFVYLRDAGNAIIGVDKKTGETRLHNTRSDFVAFAKNYKTNMIYAATKFGEVLAIKPVTKAGTVGQTASAAREIEPLALAR